MRRGTLPDNACGVSAGVLGANDGVQWGPRPSCTSLKAHAAMHNCIAVPAACSPSKISLGHEDADAALPHVLHRSGVHSLADAGCVPGSP